MAGKHVVIGTCSHAPSCNKKGAPPLLGKSVRMPYVWPPRGGYPPAILRGADGHKANSAPKHNRWNCLTHKRLGRIAQLVEQLTLNQRVQGSSPCAPTIDPTTLFPDFHQNKLEQVGPVGSSVGSFCSPF